MPRFAALALLLLTLAACGPATLDADVTRFTTLTATEPARSFSIVPDHSQQGSLEFQQYADEVAGQLSARGWRPIPASATAETVVLIHWGLGPAHTEVWQSPSAVWSGWGWGTGPWYGGGLYQAFPYYDTEVSTTWPKWVAVEILDGPAWRTGNRITVFEGRAVAEGQRPAIAPAMPYLVRALFTGFPGVSGQTVRVEVPVNQ